MSKRKFPVDLLQEHILEGDWVHSEFIGEAPGTDSLGEEWWGVFEHEGSLYRVNFIEGNSTWQDQMGGWEDPFPQAQDRMVECEKVTAVPKVVVSYEPVESPFEVAEGASCSPSDFWYDLIDGGYVKPDALLSRGADTVKAAVEILRDFHDALKRADAIEEM